MHHDAPLIGLPFLVMKLNEETHFANYVREFLNEREASNQCSSVTENETLRSDSVSYTHLTLPTKRIV